MMIRGTRSTSRERKRAPQSNLSPQGNRSLALPARISASRRAGFTLIELLLVLGLLGLAAAWVAPSWRHQLAYQRLESAAKDLRSLWLETRLRAIEEAMPYQFDVVPGTGYYRVHPMHSDEPGITVSPLDAELAGENELREEVEREPVSEQLPDGIHFASHLQDDELALETGDATDTLTSFEPDAVPDESDWQPSIRFDPRGTASGARLLLDAPEIRQRRELVLRGLTGGVTVASAPYPDALLE